MCYVLLQGHHYDADGPILASPRTAVTALALALGGALIGTCSEATRRRNADQIRANRRFLVKGPPFKRDRRKLAQLGARAALLTQAWCSLTVALATHRGRGDGARPARARQLSLAM